MDPTHHEKIADKLMQYRGKIPKNNNLSDDYARYCCNLLKLHIDNLLRDIDRIAEMDAKGLIG